MTKERRPFRDLCPEADLREAMDDGEFWAHVYSINDGNTDYFDDAPALGPLTEPRAECGAVGACAWDANGRPLIHPLDDGDES